MIRRQDHFIQNSDGTVTDRENGLMWAARDNGENISWNKADVYCRNLTLAGYQDWRLPTLSELKSLHEVEVASCHAAEERIIKLTSNYLWSSQFKSSSSAYYFSFSVGGHGSYARSSPFAGRALPVRTLTGLDGLPSKR